jgi:hypothetical protein
MHPDTDLSVYSVGLSDPESFFFGGAVADPFGLSMDQEAFCFSGALADLEGDGVLREPVAPRPVGNVIPFRPRHAEESPSAAQEDGP